MTSYQSLGEQLQAVEDERPQVYTVLSEHHQEVQTALDTCERAYPTSRQLYEALDDPEIHPTMFARVLGFLVKIEIIDTYTVRSGANRYDLRGYDAPRLTRIGNLLVE